MSTNDLTADEIRELLDLEPNATCGFVRLTFVDKRTIAPGGLPAPLNDPAFWSDSAVTLIDKAFIERIEQRQPVVLGHHLRRARIVRRGGRR